MLTPRYRCHQVDPGRLAASHFNEIRRSSGPVSVWVDPGRQTGGCVSGCEAPIAGRKVSFNWHDSLVRRYRPEAVNAVSPAPTAVVPPPHNGAMGNIAGTDRLHVLRDRAQWVSAGYLNPP